MIDPFAVKDCALITIATGERAYNIRELKDGLKRADPAIVHNHFWGALLRPRFADPEYQNDFAAWAYHELHDRRLAERLGIINPTDFYLMDDLRQKVIEVIEERMDEEDYGPRGDVDHPFFFSRSEIVIFDTNIRIDDPTRFHEIVPTMSPDSIFYHFIDSRRRNESGENDFTEWLGGFGDQYADLAGQIAAIDPYFNSLTELRDELAGIITRYMQQGSQS